MSTEMLVAGVAMATLATAFTGAVRFLVKHYLSELRPDGNGNHNLRGRVERIELRVDEIYKLLLERNG
jgi:hypothetical protein